MKKILFAAVAAMAITGCSQNEEIEKVAQPVEIGFNTAVGKATKATPMLNDNFKDFKVYAYNSGSNLIKDVTKLSTTVFMNGIKTEKGKEGLWATEGTYYWPLTDKLQFFAYSPFESEALSAWSAEGQYPSFSYTVNPVASQEDLLIAQAADKNKTDDSGSGVSLGFKHILTQVNFSATGSTGGYKYDVTGIAISGVNQTATFTFDVTAGTWGTASSVITSPYEYAGTYTTITGTETKSFDKSDGSLMLLPQTLPADAKITVTYTVKDASDATIFNGTGDVELGGVTWTAGSKIRYTLLLKDNGAEVTFVPKVDPWNEETAGPEKN